MNKYKLSLLLALTVSVTVVSLGRLYRRTTETINAINTYQIVPSDGFGDPSIVLGIKDAVEMNGTKLEAGHPIQIVISDQSDKMAEKTFQLLKDEVVHLTSFSEQSPESPIYFVGSIEKEIPGKVGRIEGDRVYKGIPTSYSFNLRGWFIKVPYVLYNDSPDDKPVPPSLRKTLEIKDFKKPIDQKNINYDKENEIFWVGVNPFIGKSK